MASRSADARRRLRAALIEHFVPRVRALGFGGGLAGLRRLTPRGVDLLMIPMFKGVVQLDAGRVKHRRELGARTVNEDWAVYANPHALPNHGAARRRLETPGGKGVWRFDDVRTPAGFLRIARAMARVVETAGEAFWARATSTDGGTEAPRRATAAARARMMKQLLRQVVVPGLRGLGFEGAVKADGSGTFRRSGETQVELVSVGIGGDSVLLQAAARRLPPRVRRSTPETAFLGASERIEHIYREPTELSPAGLTELAEALVAAVRVAGARYWARCKPTT